MKKINSSYQYSLDICCMQIILLFLEKIIKNIRGGFDMDKMQKEFNNMKNDVKEGIQKVSHAVKHTASDLKSDMKGAMASMEMKKDDLFIYSIS